MKKSITPNQIKENNKNLIYQFIYNNKKVSQQDLSYSLHLSRPTVTTNLNELESDGLIYKNGQIDSEYVGRKAAAYSIVKRYRLSIGVEILSHEIKMIAIDLYGEKIERTAFELLYEYNDDYFREVTAHILEFIHTIGARDEEILGIGFAMQALVSADGKTIIYGKILSCTGLCIDAFSKYLPYPCNFIHDANSAAIAELWISPGILDAFYLSLSTHLGAAIISNGNILVGKHGHSSTIEHIEMVSDGNLCYCGKRGCMETTCSISALLQEDESIEEFFLKLRNGFSDIRERWNKYLHDLAKSINILHLVYDTDFILGGYLSSYLCEEDILALHNIIEKLTPFEESKDFIFVSKMPKHNIAIGAALPYIQGFLKDML